VSVHAIYLVEGPSGCYVGRTRCVSRRWNQHVAHASRGVAAPLYDAMRRDGAERYTLRPVLSVSGGSFDASLAERAVMWEVSQLGKPLLNKLFPGSDELAWLRGMLAASNARIARRVAHGRCPALLQTNREVRAVTIAKIRVVRAAKKAFCAAFQEVAHV
jgi:hypothetical protein